jgi:hypothetical protein
MQIDESVEQLSKARSSRDKRRESDSNVTCARRGHALKHSWPSISTEEGMQMDESAAQSRNAELSRRESSQPDSNITLEIV